MTVLPPGIAADPLVAPFWAAARDGRIALPRRRDGAGFDWYPTGHAVDWVTVAGDWRLFSWTIVHRPLDPAYAPIVPYVSVIAVTDRAPGVRLVSRLLDPPAVLAADIPLRPVFVDIGAPHVTTGVVGPLFRAQGREG